VELFKYPTNKNEEFKGSIMESTGLYCCLLYEELENKGGIIFDDIENMEQCECYVKKEVI